MEKSKGGQLVYLGKPVKVCYPIKRRGSGRNNYSFLPCILSIACGLVALVCLFLWCPPPHPPPRVWFSPRVTVA